MSLIYVGPTITGVAARNTVFDSVPPSIGAAAAEKPWLLDLCVPLSALPDAIEQIREKRGAIYNVYKKALEGAGHNNIIKLRGE